jgi:nicotinamide-nucleotide amidase
LINLIYAEIITIGDEILYGQILDTNTKWMSEELDKIGIKIIQKTSIGDNKAEILRILNESSKRAKIVLITGGLGPTKDDITKNTLAEFFNDTLEINTHAEAFIKDFFEKRDRPFTELNRQQAAIPSRCTYLHNATGTAPGMWFDENGVIYVSMPGVPHEMQYLITKEVIPRLKAKYNFPEIVHRVIRTIGLGESFLAEKIESWEDSLPENLKLAYLPSFGEVKLRLTGFGDNKETIDFDIQKQVEKLEKIIPEYIYSTDNENIEKSIGNKLLKNKATVSIAESCTGGYVSHLLTSIPGSSGYLLGSVVSYSNESKMKLLNVKQETLSNFGAVSEETVTEMVLGALATFGTTYAIATTGIAGPDGGSPEKPVGTVWIAISNGKKTIARKLLLMNNRMINIQFSAKAALNMLRMFIDKE